MQTLAITLITLASAIPLLLGLRHLYHTFHGPKLTPRDSELKARMQQVPLVITRQTTMWKAWLGFNATHSIGLILFGVIYGYLALAHSVILFHSAFLLALGLITLIAYAVFSRLYFFRIPLIGMVLATACFAFGIIASLT